MSQPGAAYTRAASEFPACPAETHRLEPGCFFHKLQSPLALTLGPTAGEDLLTLSSNGD